MKRHKMSTVGIVSVVIVILAILILGVLFVLIAKPQNKPQKSKEKTKEKKVTLEDLLDIVADKNSTKNQLTSALLKLSSTFPFPKKNNLSSSTKNLNDTQKKYLNFVLLLASHKNADAKLIAHMDKELKAKNPTYKHEIDIYENEGLNQRKNRT